MHFVNDVAPYMVAASATVFLGVYSVMARWWMSAEGRSLVGIGVVLFLYGVVAVLDRNTPSPWVDSLRAAANAGAIGVMVQMTGLAWNAQSETVRKGGGR